MSRKRKPVVTRLELLREAEAGAVAQMEQALWAVAVELCRLAESCERMEEADARQAT